VEIRFGPPPPIPSSSLSPWLGLASSAGILPSRSRVWAAAPVPFRLHMAGFLSSLRFFSRPFRVAYVSFSFCFKRGPSTLLSGRWTSPFLADFPSPVKNALNVYVALISSFGLPLRMALYVAFPQSLQRFAFFLFPSGPNLQTRGFFPFLTTAPHFSIMVAVFHGSSSPSFFCARVLRSVI